MKITLESDDAPDFIRHVEHAVNGVFRRHSPETGVLVKINNWFGSNWLGFSGKALGALGVSNKPHDQPADNIRIPPFVPTRVVSQRRFAAPTYEEVASGKPIHIRVPSNLALLRKAATAEPRTALVWYSGNSRTAGRGRNHGLCSDRQLILAMVRRVRDGRSMARNRDVGHKA